MNLPNDSGLDATTAVLNALRALEADAQTSAGAGADASGLSDAQLQVRALAELGEVRAAIERVALRQIAALERVRVLNPESDPVRAGGHRDVGSLLAELWRISLPNARQLCDVARATAPRYTLHGDVLPPEFIHLAAALFGRPSGGGSAGEDSEGDDSEGDEASGDDDPDPVAASSRVSAEQAAVIVRELEKTGHGCTHEQRTIGERMLVTHAPGLTVEQMRRLAIRGCQIVCVRGSASD